MGTKESAKMAKWSVRMDVPPVKKEHLPIWPKTAAKSVFLDLPAQMGCCDSANSAHIRSTPLVPTAQDHFSVLGPM